jgi:hypothetical protein
MKTQESRGKNKDGELEVKSPQSGEEGQGQEHLRRGAKPVGEETGRDREL